MNVCVVCTANICRSPFVEAILRRELGSGHQVYSIGTMGICGSEAYEVCADLAPSYRINLDSHLSQGMTEEIAESTDVFLCMSRRHASHLEMEWGIAKEKIELLSEHLPVSEIFPAGKFPPVRKGDNIPDPMGMAACDVKPVLDIMETAAVEAARTIEKRA